MTRTAAFLERLRGGSRFLADGACGTLLQGRGLEPGSAPDVWVMQRPEQIRALHQDYVSAGSDIILTCTFGATHFRLERTGLSNHVEALNCRAAELARDVAGESVYVAGDMGPTGQLLAPLGRVTPEEVADAYATQAAGLAAGGADLLLIETMSDLGEAEAAIEGARRACDLPIICTFSFDTHGRTMMGVRPAQVAREIGPLVEGIGANCGKDPAEFESFMRAMRESAPEMVLWAKPNAGLPRVVGGTVTYDATPETMGRIAVQLYHAGAQIVGGCCGTTPSHVAAMAAALRGLGLEAEDA